MRLKYILYIILFTFLIVLAVQTANAAKTQVWLTPTVDGYGTAGAHFNTTTLEVTRGANTWNMYYQWNISSLPSSADILEVSLNYYGLSGSGADAAQQLYCRDMENESTGASQGQRFNDALNGELYFQTSKSSFNVGSRTLNTSFGIGVDWQNDPRPRIEENISRGWWGLGWYSNANGYGGSSASQDHATHPAPALWIEYELNAPYFNDSLTTPLDYASDVNLTPQLCVNVTHDHGNSMNLSWYWWNATNSSWDYFNQTLGVNNGTYCNWFLNATEPCTTYYWRVDAVDPFGNTTQLVAEFTSHCVLPPSGVTCTRVNDTAINLTWTKDGEANGTVHTIVRYLDGVTPPGFTEGTEATNTTNNWVVLDLASGNCYGISLWTNWNWSNNWHLSSTASTPSGGFCCTTGGNYTIAFKDEVTDESINFSRFPYNSTTFELLVHYSGRIDSDWIISTDTIEILNGVSALNITTTETPKFFELKVFTETNNSALQQQDAALCVPSEYRRILTPYVARNISGRQTVTFYVANMTVYNQYHSCWDGRYINQTLDTDFEDSVVPYTYKFLDRVGDFEDDDPVYRNVFVSIYDFNNTYDRRVIHQEFWSASVSERIRPYLIYDKVYYMGINCSTKQLDNIGYAPTGQTTTPDFIEITENLTSESALANINYTQGWQSGDGLWFYYFDTTYQTTTINLTVRTIEGDYITSQEVNVNTYNFSTGKFANITQNRSYNLILTYTRQGNSTTVVFLIFPPAEGRDVGYINTLITEVFGRSPFYNPDTGYSIPWMDMIIGITGVIILAALAGFGGDQLALIGSGAWFIGANIMVSGINPLIAIAGIVLIIMGVLWYLGGGKYE